MIQCQSRWVGEADSPGCAITWSSWSLIMADECGPALILVLQHRAQGSGSGCFEVGTSISFQHSDPTPEIRHDGADTGDGSIKTRLRRGQAAVSIKRFSPAFPALLQTKLCCFFILQPMIAFSLLGMAEELEKVYRERRKGQGAKTALLLYGSEDPWLSFVA
ncbi:uncharacterized [Tachysurus ichikawai]